MSINVRSLYVGVELMVSFNLVIGYFINCFGLFCVLGDIVPFKRNKKHKSRITLDNLIREPSTFSNLNSICRKFC